jgi:dTMP kinase
MGEKNLKGKFITFEGPEGTGKSTHSRLLYNYLITEGYKVAYVREPGGTPVSEAIRDILLDPKNSEILPITELFLCLASRAQLVEKMLLPALREGKIVICDRFQDATISYQGYGGGLDVGLIKKIGRLATGGLKPDLTILLDIAAQEGLRRSKRLDRMEKKPISFHRRVRMGYLALAKSQSRRIKVVHVRKDVFETQKLIQSIVTEFLKNQDRL